MLYNPQSFPTGTPVLTINSVTYKTNSFSISRPTQKATVTDENAAPLGFMLQEDFQTLTAELQLAASATVVPTTAATSATTGVFTLDTVSWAIESVTEPREKLGQRVVQITAQRVIA
jgi:hypothetical protein